MWACARACMRVRWPCAAPGAAAGRAGWYGWSHRSAASETALSSCRQRHPWRHTIKSVSAQGNWPADPSAGKRAQRTYRPAQRQREWAECLQCCPVDASVVHQRYSQCYSRIHHSKARVRARGVPAAHTCTPAARSRALSGVEADSRPPGRRRWLRCATVARLLHLKRTATLLSLISIKLVPSSRDSPMRNGKRASAAITDRYT